MGFVLSFFHTLILSYDWLRTFTQVDGQPAASASANVDAPIAEEPEVEAAAEVAEAQAVCVFLGFIFKITAHHFMSIGLT